MSASVANSPAKTVQAAPGLVLGAVGVVFGDIGTSPLYTLRECLKAAGGVTQPNVFGIVSLIMSARRARDGGVQHDSAHHRTFFSRLGYSSIARKLFSGCMSDIYTVDSVDDALSDVGRMVADTLNSLRHRQVVQSN